MNKNDGEGNPNLGWYAEIVHVSNWGYWLELDGRELKQGEWIEILCPDGSTIRSPVTAERFVDRGGRDEIHDHRYCVTVALNGWTDVQLRVREGMRARRIEAPAPTTEKTESPA